MATAVEQAIVEIAVSLGELEPQLEGFTDFNSLNITPESHTTVSRLIAQYTRRISFLHSAKSALEELMRDGHPTIPVQDIAQAVFDDLTNNAGTIEAALAKVKPEAAVTLGLSAGAVETK